MLSSCGSAANRAQFEEALASWINKDERELLHVWGIPDDVYQISEDEKALNYVNQSSFTIPGTAPSYTTNYIGNTVYMTTNPGSLLRRLIFTARSISLLSKTNFTVFDGKVTGAGSAN